MTTKELTAKNYKRGLWTNDMVLKLVAKGKLTSADYEEITGLEYPAEAEVSDSEALAELMEVMG